MDPTRFELLKTGAEYLAGWGLEKTSRVWAIEEAIYRFASHYHSGQASNLYSALSCSPFRPGMAWDGIEDETGQEIYRHFEETFGN